MGQVGSTLHAIYHAEVLCGSGEAVGRLPELQREEEEEDSSNRSNSNSQEEEPYTVFLSHTGKDKAKEELARPTYFFLKEILKVKVFFDDREMEWGCTTEEGLAKPAYQCTHALVILSPSFRQSRYCVKELNTFLHRYRQAKAAQELYGEQRSSFRLLPALWKVSNLDGYPHDLQKISWAARDTDDAADYMLQTLWPRLIRALGLPSKSQRELQEHFITYLDNHLGDPHHAPKELFKYAKDHGCRLFFPPEESSDGSTDYSRVPRLASSLSSHEASSSFGERSSRSVIFGISFFNIDMDRNQTWNEKVLQRKASIEENLALIAQYGEVIYGRTTMSQEQFEVGAAIVRLECRIQLRGDLGQHDYGIARDAAVGIGRLLKGAGTTEEELNQIMIGAFWKGCLVLLLEAPESLLERLHDAVVHRGESVLNAGEKNEFKVTGITPAFTIRAQTSDSSAFSFHSNTQQETRRDVVQWSDETVAPDFNILFPTSLEARGRLLACGVPYIRWGSDSLEGWNRMATTLSSYQALDMDESVMKIKSKEHTSIRELGSIRRESDASEILCESGEAVGHFPEPQHQSGNGSTNNQEEPYVVFLSYTGKDKAKEELARPTSFFLKEILNVKAYLDKGEIPLGSRTEESLATPAYQCTHALVILSPSFRQSRYCVKELNTFLRRYRQSRSAQVEQQHCSFQLLPALWKLKSLNGYPEELQHISWAAHDTENAVVYMLQTLWPRLIEALGLPPKSERELQEHFFTYLDHQLGSPRQVPNDFFKYAKDQGCRLLFPPEEMQNTLTNLSGASLSSLIASSQSDSSLARDLHEAQSVIVGVSFLGLDKDHNHTWHEKVHLRKASIEENLAIIAQYGEVIYGGTTMSLEQIGLFGLGTAAVRLECEIKLRGDLDEDDYAVARDAAIAIGKLLKGAGTTEKDLERIMIGALWRG